MKTEGERKRERGERERVLDLSNFFPYDLLRCVLGHETVGYKKVKHFFFR